MDPSLLQGGRTQLEKITAAAHERQKMTFNPQATETQRSAPPTKPKRRVSMGVVINAETGEVMEGARKRQSRRTHTMLNTSATVSRMKEEVVKKVRSIRALSPFPALIKRSIPASPVCDSKKSKDQDSSTNPSRIDSEGFGHGRR